MKRASRAKTALGPTHVWKIAVAQIPVKRMGREERIPLLLRDAARYRRRAERQMTETGRDRGRNSGNTRGSRGRDSED